ncbi:MAG: aminoacyl-tRNA hydrolase [Clostridiales bacterium]|nr:aminoacyl-tRNA hydrolase [Clostridiales bacterium]
MPWLFTYYKLLEIFMYIIVGLGNPEEKYFKTFHNMGYLAVGDAASMLGVKFKKKQCEAYTAEANVKGEKVILARPITYMNNSGRAVKQLLAKYKASVEDLIVLYDDYDIPKGKIRIRPDGSAGTHNGMRSIIAEIGTANFKRIRIGIRDEEVKIPIINYVLANVKPEDYDLFVSACERAAQAAIAIASGEKTEIVMTKFNG